MRYFATQRLRGGDSAFTALDKIKKNSFSCIISDIKMPKMSGVELCRAVKEIQPDLPIVLMSAYVSDEMVREGLEAGATAILNKPLNIELTLNFFSYLGKKRSVVIVDDDLRISQFLAEILQENGLEAIQVIDPENLIKKIKPDGQVILLDMKLKNINGSVVLKEIRRLYPSLPVVLITGYREEMADEINVALRMGAYTCLYKPIQTEKLLQVLRELFQKELRGLLSQSDRR